MEKIVTRQKTGVDFLKIAGVLLGGLVLMAALLLFGGYAGFLAPLIGVGIIYGIWYLLTDMNREYEYIVTNGDLDIDLIIARRKRKRIYSGKSKEFELMAKVGSDDYRQAQKGSYKLLDCSSRIQSPDNWFVLTDYKGQRLMLIFAPDERMLKSLKRFNPSKIKYTLTGA